MKKIYLSPEMEIENINVTNIIATSPGPDAGGIGGAGDDADSKIIDFDEDVDIEW